MQNSLPMRSTSAIFLADSCFCGWYPPCTRRSTLRTYGPRIGFNLAPLIGYFTDPQVIGADASLDFEIYRNIYPVFELGFGTLGRFGG